MGAHWRTTWDTWILLSSPIRAAFSCKLSLSLSKRSNATAETNLPDFPEICCRSPTNPELFWHDADRPYFYLTWPEHNAVCQTRFCALLWVSLSPKLITTVVILKPAVNMVLSTILLILKLLIMQFFTSSCLQTFREEWERGKIHTMYLHLLRSRCGLQFWKTMPK